MLPEGLFAVRSLYERCLEQVVQAQFDTLLDIVAVLLDLDDDVFHTGGLGILEDGVESDHAALADFAAILDMEHLEAAGVFVEITDKRFLLYPLGIPGICC